MDCSGLKGFMVFIGIFDMVYIDDGIGNVGVNICFYNYWYC